MRKRIAIIAGLGACGAAAFLSYARPSSPPGPPPSGSGTETGSASAPTDRPGPGAWGVVCTGRVEPIGGEVDVSAQVGGRLDEVRVKDGDVVEAGQILAVVDGPRQAAELEVAEAAAALARTRLEQLEAGTGAEEIAQALFDAQAVETRLAYERERLHRTRQLFARSTASRDELQRQAHEVEQLERQLGSLRKRHEALRRGPLPEEVAVARSELAVSEAQVRRVLVEDDQRLVRAPSAGTILEVYRHEGDSVSLDQPTPVLRMADMSRIRIRLEVNEQGAPSIRPGIEGTFRIRGTPADAGRLVVTAIVPSFGPKRLFNPDASARFDTRILTVLCEPSDSLIPLYSGQRVTASLSIAPESPGVPPPGPHPVTAGQALARADDARHPQGVRSLGR